jgi:hypothetical protein
MFLISEFTQVNEFDVEDRSNDVVHRRIFPYGKLR